MALIKYQPAPHFVPSLHGLGCERGTATPAVLHEDVTVVVQLHGTTPVPTVGAPQADINTHGSQADISTHAHINRRLHTMAVVRMHTYVFLDTTETNHDSRSNPQT